MPPLVIKLFFTSAIIAFYITFKEKTCQCLIFSLGESASRTTSVSAAAFEPRLTILSLVWHRVFVLYSLKTSQIKDFFLGTIFAVRFF